MRVRLLPALAVLSLTASVASAQPAPVAQAPAAPVVAPAVVPVVATGDVVDTLRASGQFTVFLKGTDATNLTGFLKARKDITIMAPTDAAFAALPPADLARLLAPANRGELQKLLLYHLINARVPLSEFKGAIRSAPTLAGLPVDLNGGDVLLVNAAPIQQADVLASNGVILVLSSVLNPAAAPVAAPAAPAEPAKP